MCAFAWNTALTAATVQMVDPPTVDLKAADSLSAVVDSLGDDRVVYVGEVHTAYADHLVQLAVLRRLHDRDPKLAIGVEWFQQPYQEHLDAYIRGEIGEGEMLARTEYFSRWSFDYRLYRPILRFARDHGIPVVALNAPAELTRAVGELGRADVPEELLHHLPSAYGPVGADYQERLREVFDAHPERADNGGFERFVEVQLTWDESMAERVAAYLASHPVRRMVVFAGRGHIGHGSGIPSRVARRSGIEGRIVLVAHGDGEDREAADFLVLASPRELPEAGLMGVILDTDDEEGVRVKALSPAGAAAGAGVEKDDILVAIDGRPVPSYADVKLALLDKAPGERIRLSVRRSGLITDREEILELELKGRGAMGMAHHP